MAKVSSFPVFFLLGLSAFSGAATPVGEAPPAPSSLAVGPYAASIQAREYRLPPSVDPWILPDRMTELWAKTTWPAGAGGPLPLVVFLHGNHATCGVGSHPRQDRSCEYTASGACPAGSVVVPNHEGYDYLARHLASWGFAVVSINANRGITCGSGVSGDSGLNLARGRLVLRHLQYLHQASNGVSIDWSRVGLMGHSRGGEGMRAAYHYYRNPGDLPRPPVGAVHASAVPPLEIPSMTIRSIFEIGAVDGQTSKVLDADGVVWNQLLPMCDGDVSDLEGRYPFERMLSHSDEGPWMQKSLSLVWGANHNFFNTEWQVSDSTGCLNHAAIFPSQNGSPQQQLIAAATLPAFFLGTLGAEAVRPFNRNFNPLFALPKEVDATTRVEREFVVSPSAAAVARFEDFDRDSGVNTSGQPNSAQGVTVTHVRVDRVQRAGKLEWNHAGADVFFEAHWTPESQGRDLSGYSTLDFRVARVIGAALDPRSPIRFSVQLGDASGHGSSLVPVEEFVQVVGPGNSEVTFQTVRVPLARFAGVDARAIRSVRFVMNASPTGILALASIRFSRSIGVGAEVASALAPKNASLLLPRGGIGAGALRPAVGPRSFSASGKVVSILRVDRADAFLGQPGIELRIEGRGAFPVRDQLSRLRIGNRFYAVGGYAEGRTNRLKYTLTPAEFAAISSGTPVSLVYGVDHPAEIYDLGTLDRSLLK